MVSYFNQNFRRIIFAVTINFSFNLTLMVARKTCFDEYNKNAGTSDS
jgi:hypothetical protein